MHAKTRAGRDLGSIDPRPYWDLNQRNSSRFGYRQQVAKRTRMGLWSAKSALSWAVVMSTGGRGVSLSCQLGGSYRPNHCLLLVYRWGATRSSSSDSATITFLSPRSTSTCSPTILVRL